MTRTRVVGYTRMGRAEVGSPGMSLESQAAALEEAARRRGWELVDVCRDEREGGHALARKGLRAALSTAARPDVDALMVTRLDRIGYAARDFQWLRWLQEEASARFVALDPSLDTGTTAGACAADVIKQLALGDRWAALAAHNAGWSERNAAIAHHIEPGSSVIDLGSGPQSLRGELPPGCEYQPCDVVDGPGVLRCDFNRGIWPQTDRVHDVAVVSGVLEYVHAAGDFLRRLPDLAERVLLTHAIRPEGGQVPIGYEWVTYLTRPELKAAFAAAGLIWTEIGAWQDQTIFELTRAPGS